MKNFPLFGLFLLGSFLCIGCASETNNGPVTPAQISEEERRVFQEEQKKVFDLERKQRSPQKKS